MARIIGTCAGDDRQTTVHRRTGKFYHIQMFRVVQRGGFARGAADDDCICAARDLLLQQFTEPSSSIGVMMATPEPLKIVCFMGVYAHFLLNGF